MAFLLWLLRGEGAVLERQPVPPAAALDRVAGLGSFGERDLPVALRAAHPMGQRGDPATFLCPHPEGMPGSVRALDEIARLHSIGKLDRASTVRTAHGRHG